MANVNETPLDRYLKKVGYKGNTSLTEKYSSDYYKTASSESKNNGGVLGGIGYTVEQLGLGLVRGIEGIGDFIVGGIADLAGDDELADELMKNDWLNYNHANEWYNPSGAMQTVGEISAGVGTMLPAIAVSAVITYFSGGSAAPAAATLLANAAGAATITTSAAGQATSEAAKQSGTAGGKEWAYGIGSGLAEGAVEFASGGIGGAAAGTVFGKQVAKSTAGKLAASAIGEGLEEVAGDYIDVGLKRATGVDKKAQLPTAKELGHTFVVGAGVGGVLGGAGRAIKAKQVGGFNNLNAIENAQELSERLSENNLRQAKGKKARYVSKDIYDTAQRLSNNLQKMKPDKRKAYLESNAFMKAIFDENGKILDDVSVSPTASNNTGPATYSASLRGRENSFAYQPAQTVTETSKDAMNTVSLLTKGKAEVVLTDHDFGTVKDAYGNKKKINGEYRNGIIYLSANATAEDAVRVVAEHEMAHTLEGTKEYNALGDYIKEYIKKHPDLKKRYNFWDYAIAYANSQKGNYTAETKAYEVQTDIYADFIANEILNSQESVNRLANRDANIVKKFLSWVRTAIKNLGAGKEARAEYKELRRMEKMLAKALDAARGGVTLEEFDKAVRKRKGEAVAETKGKPAEARASLSSISQSFFGEQVSLKDFESRKYKETEGYKKYVEECVSNLIKSRENLNEAEARKEIEASIDGVVDVAVAMKKAGYDILDVGEHRKARDSKKRLLFSSLEPNSDYFTSHDISTICDKRKNFAEIYDEIVAREEKMGIPKGKRFFANVDNYFVLHDILASKGLTAACKQCYVESMRKNLAPMANAFLELMQEKNASNRSNKQLFNTKGEAKVGNTELRENLLKTIAEEEYDITADDLTIKMLTTARGLVQLKIQAPLIYEAFNSFYGQSKPKMPRQAVPFRFGELSAMLRNHNGTINQTLVKKINSTGGFRLQSYSDFQIENWADVLQVIFEAGTLGLNGHAYTKVPAFLDATEGTNLKRNISVFMYKDNEVKGVDKWRIDKKDSFPAELKDIYAIVQADASGNTGIIAVSQNDDMSAWIMANAMIAYGIPFHKSGIKMDTVRKNTVRDGKRVIEGYLGIKDHTRQQSEVWKKTEDDHKAFTRVKKAINIYEWWDFANTENLSQKKLIEKNVKRYIDECEKAGYYPKFRDYVMDNDGILNKIVAYSKAFGDANATVDSISFEYKGYRIPYGYYKFLGDFGMFKPNGKASPQKVLSLANYDFKKAVEYFSKPAELRREEILQQFDNETVREDYRKSDLTAEQLEEIVKQKRKEVADEIIDKRYGKKDGESRLSIQIGDRNVSTQGKYQFDTDSETMLREIAEQNAIENFLPKGLSSNFVKAIQKSNGFARPRLYRGMSAAELDYIIENGFIKSNSSYNFSYQQGETRFSPRIQTAFSYATGFSPAGIRELFFEEGQPAYIVEVGNYANLNFINEDTEESYTKQEIDVKYITRIIELTYDKETHKVKAKDIVINEMNNAKGEALHGVPMFVKDKVTGTILYAHQGVDGFEDGKYISEKNPDILFDYEMVDAHKNMKGFNYNDWLGISGKESNLVPYEQNTQTTIDKTNGKEYNDDVRYSIYTPRDINTVTKKDYEHHYWAFANGIISQSEWGVVNNAISDIKLGKRYPKTSNNLYMISTGEYRGSATVYNKIVFTNGDFVYPSIEMILEVDENIEKQYSYIGGLFNAYEIGIYTERELRGIIENFSEVADEEVWREYRVNDFQTLQELQEQARIRKSSRQNNQNNRGINERNGNLGEAEEIGRISVTVDSQNNQLTAEQQEFFKDSKVRDENGKLLVVYHGTPNGRFYEFSYDKAGMEGGSEHGYGFYFSESKKDANLYTQGKGNIIEAHLNITNPIDAMSKDLSSNVGNIFDRLPMYAKNNLVEKYGDLETAKKQFAKWDNGTMLSILCRATKMHPAVFNNILLNLGYDGIVYNEDGYATEYVAFKSNQAKTITNKKPTQNPDIRYSVSVNQTPQATKINTVNTPKQKLTNDEKIQAVKDQVGEKWLDLQIQTTNVHAGIEHEAKVLGGNLEAEVHRARASSASAINALTNEQRDYSGKNRVGDSLVDIFEPVFKEGPEHTQDFYTYLYHWHNTDRVGLEEKAQAEIDALLKADAKLKEIVERKNIGAQSRERLIKKTENGKRYLELLEVKNIPVMRNELGDIVTATESKAEIKVIEKAHPEFKAIAEKVWKYSRNNIQYRLDAGLITQELADLLLKKYPHYVPTYREKDVIGTAGVSRLTKGVRVKQTIKKAKGSDADLADIFMSLTKQTLDIYRAAAVNNVAVKLHDLAMGGKSDNVVLMEEKTEAVNEDTEYNEKLPDQEVAFYKDGKRYVMAVSKPINEGFKAFTSDDNYGGIEKLFEMVNQAFKAGVTSLNPLFLIRNFARDMQEAYFYTQYGAIEFSKAILRAIKIMAKKGDLWQRYLAAGGLQSGIVSRETGVYDSRSKTRKKLAKPLDAMEKANQFIEQIPRFAEFILAIENGKSDAQALLESADVTTNFSRGGKLAKKLNRTVMPFLNPSIQGFSKLWRTATGRKSARQWTQLIVKSLVVGLAVGFFNDLINGDDEDYKNLNVRDKENYYIFPLGDGKFIKIPKGRVVAALGTITSRIKSAAEGDENWNEGWLQSVGDMVTPVGQMTRFIWSPFTDARTNTTWYGGEIEGKGLQNLAVKDRYDEGTSSIAIWMGKTFNISPKKVHYVIDQYSGVIGDIILPLTTEKAERGMISSAFTIDGVTSNRISTNFYDMKDEMMYAKNSGDMYADMVYSYLNKVSSEVSDMYQQKREIQSNSKLSNKEKIEQTKVIQALINTTMQSAMVSAEQFEQILIDMGYTDSIQAILKSKAYNNMDEETQTKVAKKFKDYSYAMAMSTLTGEKTDAKYYLYNSIGAEDISIYLTEISGITADKDKKGNVTTTRKEKVHKYIEHLKLSKEQKYILMYLAGYTPTEEGKKYVENYLRKNSFTAKELENLWE